MDGKSNILAVHDSGGTQDVSGCDASLAFLMQDHIDRVFQSYELPEKLIADILN